jgi:hypothetical protein
MRYLFILFALLFTACSQDKAILKSIKQNEQKHLELSKTYYVTTKSANIFIKDISSKDAITLLLNIKPKNLDESIAIQKCTLDKQESQITTRKTLQDSQWESEAIITIAQNSKRVHSLSCILSNGEKLSKLIR